MTTHTHPEIQAEILELSKTITSEIGASENRLRADMDKIEGRVEVRYCRASIRYAPRYHVDREARRIGRFTPKTLDK